MITVVTFLWRRIGEPLRYTSQHVNTLRAALRRRLSRQHRFVCVTDNGSGLDPDIACVPLSRELVDGSVRRYLKLMAFRRDAADLFGGDRLLCLDLDVTPVGEFDPIVGRDEDFVIWRDPLAIRSGYERSHRYNSSMILMNAGARPHVYETFNSASPDKVRASGLIGSDQAWIGLALGPNEAVWTQADGVLGWRHDLEKGKTWPDSARLIVSHSRPKPWELEADHPLRVAYEMH